MDESIEELLRKHRYHDAYDYFNDDLFDTVLPDCSIWPSTKTPFAALFPLGGQPRESGAQPEDRLHLIQINPDLLTKPPIFVMSVLVHEQCHLWQLVHGTPSRSVCHDRQWSEKMESIGLMPSRTGLPGGKRTGRRISHYVIEGGRFETAFRSMPEPYLLPWQSHRAAETHGRPSIR